MLPFQSYDPNAPTGGSFKPPRLVSCKAGSKDPFDIGPGDNQLYILPSCSNYQEFVAAGWQGYMPGAFYTKIRVKTYGDRFAQDLRVDARNELTDAYWKLYNALCPNKKVEGTLLDKIKKDGFDAGIDNRCLLNIVRNTHQGLSTLRWFDVGAEKPGADITKLQRKRLLTQIMEALGQIHQQTGGQIIGLELHRAALLKLGVQFSGNIAQFQYALPEFTGQGFVISDISSAIPDFNLAQLDEARAWASERDQLPPLDQIPALVECGPACDLLGLQCNRVPANPAQVAPGFQPVAAPQYPVQGFQVPVGYPQPQQQVTQPPAGYPQTYSAPPVQAPPIAAPPVQPQSAPQYQTQQTYSAPPVQAPPIAAPPVQAPPLSTMNPQSAAAASQGFTAMLHAQAQAQQNAQGQPDSNPF